jgi:hypothetical protein
VLPYRAWDLLNLIGKTQAHTLLRQSVRYCVKAESWSDRGSMSEPRTLLPKILDEHKLLSRRLGDRQAEDHWVEQLSQTCSNPLPNRPRTPPPPPWLKEFHRTPSAKRLRWRRINGSAGCGPNPRERFQASPSAVCMATRSGFTRATRPMRWRNMARVSNPQKLFRQLDSGAYQVALDRTARGGDFLNWQALPLVRHVEQTKATDAGELLREADEAIRGNLQAKPVQ